MAMSKEEFDELKIPIDDRIMELFDSAPNRTLTTTEIRAEIEISHQTLLTKLDNFAEGGKLEKKTYPGSRVTFWTKIC